VLALDVSHRSRLHLRHLLYELSAQIKQQGGEVIALDHELRSPNIVLQLLIDPRDGKHAGHERTERMPMETALRSCLARVWSSPQEYHSTCNFVIDWVPYLDPAPWELSQALIDSLLAGISARRLVASVGAWLESIDQASEASNLLASRALDPEPSRTQNQPPAQLKSQVQDAMHRNYAGSRQLRAIVAAKPSEQSTPSFMAEVCRRLGYSSVEVACMLAHAA